MSTAKRSLLGLYLVNVFMADVRDGIGVYLSVYLLTVQHWSLSHIGIVLAIPGVVSILAHPPIGHLIDKSQRKRLLLVVSSAVVALACLVVIFAPQFWPIAVSQVAMGIIGPIFQPCVSAISLGLVGHALLRPRIGRNESFNHAGNLFAAVVAVVVTGYIAFEGIFYFSLLQCAAMIGAVLLIRARDIDDETARSADSEYDKLGTFWRDSFELLKRRDVRAFILSLTLWNLANGAMLPMLGQKLGVSDASRSAFNLSLCIIIAQAFMIGVAPWTAKQAQFGRKHLFLISFILIFVRAAFFAFSDDKTVLISMQAIDGIGAGIYGVLSILMMADLGRGTGRFNLLQGLTYAFMGLGGAASVFLGGYISQYLGFTQAFIWMGLVGIFGGWYFWFFVEDPAVVAVESKPKTGYSGAELLSNKR